MENTFNIDFLLEQDSVLNPLAIIHGRFYFYFVLGMFQKTRLFALLEITWFASLRTPRTKPDLLSLILSVVHALIF